MVFEKVQSILTEQLGVEESAVTLAATLSEDLGADSLDVVELVMAIEEEFGIEIGEGEAEAIGTVGDLVDYITEHQA